MSKYYYRVNNSEDYRDISNYYTEDEAEYDEISICGNKEFKGMNEDLVKDVAKNLENCLYDIDHLDDRFDFETEEEETKEIIDTIKYYFKKKDGSQLTNKEINNLFRLTLKFENANTRYNEDDDIVCKVLSILSGKKYEFKQIDGYSQGDWNYFYYPTSLGQGYIDFIEAIYFDTGSEIFYCTQKLESPDEFDEHDTEAVYCPYTLEKNIKEFLADRVFKCNVDEIEEISF